MATFSSDDRCFRSQPKEAATAEPGDSNSSEREDPSSPPRLVKDSSSQAIAIPETPILEMEKEGNKNGPPMSVIVVSSTSRHEHGHGQSVSSAQRILRQDDTGREVDTNPAAASSSTECPFSTPFRLQPRKPIAVATPSSEGASRGRKRNAQSMNTSNIAARGALLTSKGISPPAKPQEQQYVHNQESQASSTTEDESLSEPDHTTAFRAVPAGTPTRHPSGPLGSTPPRPSANGLGRVDVNFQCLSLQSPKPRRHSPSNHQQQSYPSPPPPLTDACPASAAASPAKQRSSSMFPPRSSFTPFHPSASSSPGGSSLRSIGSGSLSIGSNTRMNASARAASPGGSGSTKSSPKIAPLTVLTHNNCKGGTTATEQLQQQPSTIKTPQRPKGNRPPLPGTMNSLWYSMESKDNNGGSNESGEDQLMLPPRTVDVPRYFSDSVIDTAHHNSVQSPLPHRRSPSGMILSPPSAFASPSAAQFSSLTANNATTPRSKQPRFHGMSSPSQTTKTPRTPQQTPLPRVSLTPRSASSRNSARENAAGVGGLPHFPSPSDADRDASFLSTATTSLRDACRMDEEEGRNLRRISAIRSLFPTSSNSLALSSTDGSAGNKKSSFFPVLDLPDSGEQGKESNIRSSESGGHKGFQSWSLLSSSRSGGIMQLMMEEGKNHNYLGDLGSVSDIEDDDSEGFVLASPGAIERESLANIQPARQRRRRMCDIPSDGYQHSVSPPGSANASNANLAGMNYVSSTSSLLGMDIADPSEQQQQQEKHDDDESTDDFFALSLPPKSRGDTSGIAQCKAKRRKSDSSCTSIGLTLEGNGGDTGGRDLVTPPVMPTASTPPPLSPKGGYYIMPMTRQDNKYSNLSPRDHVAADSQTVNNAMGRMAYAEAQQHMENSPVLQA